MFLLVPTYPGCPGQTAVKWLLLLFNPAGRWGIVPVLTGTVGSHLVPSTAGMVGKDGQHIL